MENERIFAACAFAIAMIYMLHGGWVAGRWGVDPSRRMPEDMAGKKRRLGAGVWAAVGMVSCLWMALILYSYVWDLYDVLAGALAVIGTALACGVLAFAALFVCVRTGMDLAQAAGEELFEKAKPILYIAAAITGISLSGVTVMLVKNPEAYMLPAYGAAGWLALGVMTASQRVAPVIRRETHMQPAAYGSMVCVGMITLVLCVAEERMDFAEMPMRAAVGTGMTMVALMYPACLAGDAIRGLLKSPLPKKKKTPDWVWTPVCMAVSAAVGLLCGEWVLAASVAAGCVYVLLTAAACTKWFYRIGRGLFSRY